MYDHNYDILTELIRRYIVFIWTSWIEFASYRTSLACKLHQAQQTPLLPQDRGYGINNIQVLSAKAPEESRGIQAKKRQLNEKSRTRK